jgi:hypothetical protein
VSKFFCLNPSAAHSITTKEALKRVDMALTLEIADLTSRIRASQCTER